MDHHTERISSDEFQRSVKSMSPLELKNNFGMEVYSDNHLPEFDQLKQGVTFYYFLENICTGWGMPKMRSSIHSSPVKEIEFDYFYPHDLVHWLTKDTDLGILAHVSTLVALIEHFPTIDDRFHLYHNHKKATPELLAYLDKAGARSREPIKDYTRKCVDYANSRGFNFGMPDLEHHFF